jgi:biopolymer transport protein ExbB
MAFTLAGAEWILWVLVLLSVLSVALIIERAVFFWRHRLASADRIVQFLLVGDAQSALAATGHNQGMQAAVVRAGVDHQAAGPEAVQRIIALTISHERRRYERGLAFLGTLGANAPFIGLFGTVLGIIEAFHELAQAAHQGGQAAGGGAPQVMSGISEALVATAIGLLVAIPAVVAFNAFNRLSHNLVTSANELGEAVVARIHSTGHTAQP